MKPCYWLASYPKSGNTWFRMLIANLLASDGPGDINAPPISSGIASDRPPFDADCWIESALLRSDEVEALRPAFHRYRAAHADRLVADTRGVPFHCFKTHDAYSVTAGGEALLGGAEVAAGALLVVRDPRDVAPSFAQHIAVSVDRAIDHMSDPNFAMNPDSSIYQAQLRQRLLGWSEFNRSWLDQRDIPVHLVRYEDLHADPVAMLSGALDFLGWTVAPEAIDRAVRFSSFDELARQESMHGFVEAPRRGTTFFRRGKAQGWRDELSDAQARRIEQGHSAMMARLGYSIGDQASL